MKKQLLILICATFVLVGLATVVAQDQQKENSNPPCNDNEFGFYCDQHCYCFNDEKCNQTTGHCPNGCKNHYKMPICDTCNDGYFGTDCNQQCHCLNASDCDPISGDCKSGNCSIGYEGKSCQKLTGFPKFEASGIDQSVIRNQTFVFTCTAVGVPLPTIIINYHDNLTADGDVTFTNDAENKTTALLQLFSDILGLHEIECKALNIHGSVTEKLNITVVDPPELNDPPVVIGKPSAHEIAISWKPWMFEVDKGGFPGDIIYYLVVYRLTGSHLWINSGDWQLETTHNITNLLPDADYDIAIRCKRHEDNYGEGGVGNLINAVTVCDLPNENGKVQNVSSRIIAPSIVQLNWQAPKQENLGCHLNSFLVSYQQVGSSTTMLNSTVILNADQLNYEFLHLEPQSKYSFELTAITSFKNSSSVLYTVNTADFVPGHVTNLSLQEIPNENHQLRLIWSRPPNVTAADDKYIDYNVTVKLLNMKACDPSNDKLENITILKNSTTEAFVSNLHPYSEYMISVQARSIAGTSDAIELTANTTEGVPSGVPAMIVVEEIDLNSLLFRWDPVPCEQANGQLGYRYSLTKFDGEEEKGQSRQKRSDKWIVNNETYENNVTIKNLLNYTNYEFSVKGFTSAGEGPAKKIVKRTSENYAPKLSEPPIVTNVEKNEITVEWCAWNSNSNETIVEPEYKVFYRLLGQTWLEEDQWQSENSSTIYNLTQDSEYEISVRVRNKGKEGPLEPTVDARTKCGLLTDDANLQNATLKLLSEKEVKISWEPPKIGCGFSNYSLHFETIETSWKKSYNVSGFTRGFSLSGLRLNTGYFVNLTALTTLDEVYKYSQLFFNTSNFQSDIIDISSLQIKSVNSTQLQFAPVSRAPVVNSDKNISYKILVKLKSQIACNTILDQTYSQVINTTVDDIVTISNLSSYSLYEFSVEMVSGSGFNKTIDLKANTTEAIPFVYVANIYSTERQINRLSFRWDPIPCNEANGQLAYRYSLLERREPEVLSNRRKRQTTWIPVVNNVTSDTNVTFDNLTIFTFYEFHVKAFTSAGETAASSKIQQTAEDIPLPPNLSMINLTSNSFLFDIIPTLPLRGIVTEHQIEISNCRIEQNPCNKNPSDPIIDFNATNMQPLVDNLLPFSSWDVRIRAKTVVGWGNWSSTLQFTTEEGLPGEPGINEIFEINSTAVHVQLKPPIYPNGILLTYEVNCYLWKNESLSFDGSSLITNETKDNYSTLVLLNGLEVGYVYIIKAFAKTKAGPGAVIQKSYFMSGVTDFSRKIGSEYPPPPTPLLIKYISGQDYSNEITLETKIFAVKNTSGIRPVYYQIIVKKLEFGEAEKNLNVTPIADYNNAKSANTPYWIAAVIRAEALPLDESIPFIVGDKKYYNGFYNGPIFKNSTYTVMSRIFSDQDTAALSLVTPMAIQPKDGEVKVKAPGGCVIAGVSCLWFMIIVIVFVLLFWIIVAIVVLCKRRRRTKRLSISEGRMNNSIKTGHPNNIWPKKSDGSNADDSQDTSLTVFQSTDSSLQSGRSKTFNKNCNFFGPILVKDLAEYINQRAANPKIDFPEEYKQATRDKSKPWTIAKKPENLKKNRYGNILPYDMTRVRLEPHPGQPDTDYINASFIDGYDKPKGYIATQGPKENTFQDFWRMVWQENAVVIVMLTALVECRKKKCDQYWPSNSRLYGNILVTLTSTEHLADIIIRHFDIKSIEAAEIREVTHYHYTDWPDFSLPPCITSVLNLRRKVREEMQKRVSRGPFIVHCSGGAGRTGTFIAIDAMLNQAYEEDRINVFRFTGVMWGCRCNLIQNVDQYRFVYDAVLEALQSGDTKVICNRLPTYYRDICRTSECEPSDLAEQFNILNRLERRSSCFSCPEALNEENTKKNRNQEILPIEHSRVRLRSIYEPVFEEDETEEDRQPSTIDPYINAVLVDGFKLKGQFLVTHMPLDDTVQDFWRMIVLNKSSVIVMLNDCEFIDENTVPGQYWPNEGCIQYGPYQVEVVQFEEMGMVTLRTLRVIDTRKVNEFMPLGVMQLQFLDWIPDKKVPAAVSSILSLVNFADVYRHKYGGPITLHCQDGASRCGVFCAAYNVKEQIETGEVDIFQTIKRLRRHRPQFITSIEQYQFCYEVAAARVAELNKDSTLSTLV